MLKKIYIILYLSTFSIFSQSVKSNSYSDIIRYLDLLRNKSATNINLQFLPISRDKIQNQLINAEKKHSYLTYVQKKKLEYFLADYILINKDSTVVEEKIPWRLLNYANNDFSIIIQPYLNVGIRNFFDDQQYIREGGISFWGGYKNFGFNFFFKDSWIKGDQIDIYQQFNHHSGYETYKRYDEHIEFSEIQGSVTYGTSNFSVSLGKERFKIGSGVRGSLILSEKAPSFPNISFSWQPVDWLKFNYFHGWLNSRIPDSSRSYDSRRLTPDSTYLQRVISIPKYIANHSIQLNFWNHFDILLGESIIYSDEGPKVGFLIPLLFFRAVDHYYEGGNYYARAQAGGNTQFFLDLNYRGLRNISFYSTIFADEFSITGILDGDNSRNQFGYTLGFTEYDNVLPNLSLGFEYTKILPWVYSNLFDAQTYTHSDYLLGHYIGQNADRILMHVTYSPFRALEVKLTAEKIRQGGFDDVSNQYSNPGEEFLYGPLRKEENLSMKITYNPFHYFNIIFNLNYFKISDEETTRTPDYMIGENINFSFFVQYGL